MISLIAKRRFLSNILNLRFIITFVLCQILFVASTFIFTRDYHERQVQYEESVRES